MTSLSHSVIGLDFFDYFKLTLDVPNRTITFPDNSVKNGVSDCVSLLYSPINDVGISDKNEHVKPPAGLLLPHAEQTNVNLKGLISDDLLVSIDSDSKIPDHMVCSTPGNDDKLTSQDQPTFSSLRPAMHRTSKTALGLPPCTNNEQLQRSDRFPWRQRYKQKKRLIYNDTSEFLCMPPPVHSGDSTTQCMPVDFYESESARSLSNSVFSTVNSNLNPLAPPFIPDSEKQNVHVSEVGNWLWFFCVV